MIVHQIKKEFCGRLGRTTCHHDSVHPRVDGATVPRRSTPGWNEDSVAQLPTERPRGAYTPGLFLGINNPTEGNTYAGNAKRRAERVLGCIGGLLQVWLHEGVEPAEQLYRLRRH